MVRFALFFLIFVLSIVPGHSETSDFDDIPLATLGELPLDRLFEQLSSSPTAATSQPYEAEILERFHASGSDAVDLLLAWAMAAMRESEHSVALDYLDQVVLMDPSFAEGWNKRATVHYLRSDYAKSLADIEKTLQLQPKHFGALSGLGLVLMDLDERERAVDAFKMALDVHPHLKNAQSTLEELEAELAGDPI